MEFMPYLLKFKQPCLSPKRARQGTFNAGFKYDSSLSQLVLEKDGEWRPVISCSSVQGLVTKKRDTEDGDDMKDRWMPPAQNPATRSGRGHASPTASL